MKEKLIKLLFSLVIYQRLKYNNLYKLFGIYWIINFISKYLKFANYVFSLFTLKFGEKPLNRVANVLLLTAPVRKEYSKILNESLGPQKESIKKQWAKFGKLHTKIPEDGLSEIELIEFIDNLTSTTERSVVNNFYSGSIYSYSLVKVRESKNQKMALQNGTAHANGEHGMMNGFHKSPEKESEVSFSLKSPDDYEKLCQSLCRLYTYSFEQTYLWNSLHEGEFGVGYWLNYQIVRMVAEMYGGKPEDCMGLVTSGGTDSLMSAIRLYRNWGFENKNLDIGQGTIIACENVHAAVNKGCIAYSINLVLVPTDSAGKMDVEKLKSAVKEVGNSLIAIVASTPNFTLGVVDNIPEIAKVAKASKVGLHVDSCLGGFIVNFLDEQSTKFLAIDGVTSLSCDTHKNGWAPKGSSVLVTKKIWDAVHKPSVNLSFYSAYAIPNWDGGVYGSPSNPGSQHVTHLVHAYLAMLRIGKNGYRQIAAKIQEVIQECKQVILEEKRLELLGDANCNVFAFKIATNLNWGFGAGYALAHELSKRKIICSAMKGDRLHYCMTGRSAVTPHFAAKFKQALTEALDQTEVHAMNVKKQNASFPGDAGLYGTLEAALTPSTENTKNYGEFISNKILGKRVAEDSVCAHFYSLQDPFADLAL